MTPAPFPQSRAELWILVVCAVAVIFAIKLLQQHAAHRRRQVREGYPPRPTFFTRVRRALSGARHG